MTKKIELPPLPKCADLLKLHTAKPGKVYFSIDQVQAYARAAVAQSDHANNNDALLLKLEVAIAHHQAWIAQPKEKL